MNGHGWILKLVTFDLGVQFGPAVLVGRQLRRDGFDFCQDGEPFLSVVSDFGFGCECFLLAVEAGDVFFN